MGKKKKSHGNGRPFHVRNFLSVPVNGPIGYPVPVGIRRRNSRRRRRRRRNENSRRVERRRLKEGEREIREKKREREQTMDTPRGGEKEKGKRKMNKISRSFSGDGRVVVVSGRERGGGGEGGGAVVGFSSGRERPPAPLSPPPETTRPSDRWLQTPKTGR